MSEVRRTSFAMFSKWFSVMYASSPNAQRSGIMIVITSATPLKIAPATK